MNSLMVVFALIVIVGKNGVISKFYDMDTTVVIRAVESVIRTMLNCCITSKKSMQCRVINYASIVVTTVIVCASIMITLVENLGLGLVRVATYNDALGGAQSIGNKYKIQTLHK